MRFFATLGVILVVGSFSQISAAQVIRGPYLQQGTTSTMTVVWRTKTPTSSQLWYGPTPNDLKSAGVLEGGRTEHEFKVEGLQADARYFYAIGSKDRRLAGGDESYYFRTAPTTASKNHVRFWIVGDSGNGSQRQLAVRDRMVEFTHDKSPDLFLHMGDMAYSDGEDREFQKRFFDVYAETLRNTVCWPTLGNHEGRNSDSQTETGPYYYAFVLPRGAEAGGLPSGTEAYYAFDYANIHVVVLDSQDSDRSPGGPMLSWLKQDLEATDQDWIIAYWHHPAYSKGTHDSDRERQLIQMRENALPILEAAGVDLVLAGHSHIYERSYLINGAFETPTRAAGHVLNPSSGAPNIAPYNKPLKDAPGTVYITAGHGGAGMRRDHNPHPLMYFTETEQGSVMIDVHGSILVAQNLRHDGEVTDAFSIIKGRDAVMLTPIGGEMLKPGSTQVARWAGPKDEPFVVEISNGVNWTLLGESDHDRLEWTVPDSPAKASLRIRSKSGDIHAMSHEFSIGVPPHPQLVPPSHVVEPSPPVTASKPSCSTTPNFPGGPFLFLCALLLGWVCRPPQKR